MAQLSTLSLGASLTAETLYVRPSSLTGVAIGYGLWVDRELLTVLGPAIGAYVPVQRGQGGSTAAVHNYGKTVYMGTLDQFYTTNPTGVPPTPPLVTPWINTVTGQVWVVDALTNSWVLFPTTAVQSAVVTLTESLLTALLREAKLQNNILLQPGLNVSADLDAIRSENEYASPS